MISRTRLIRICLIATVIAAVAGPALPSRGAAPASSGPQVIELGALHGKMRFDREELSALPGARIRLVFKNTDEMQHNWILLKPGKDVTLRIAQKAWAMGATAQLKQFVPEDPAVIVHTRVLNPQESDTIEFTAPEQEGDYPYVCTLPGHAFSMKGILRVGQPPPDSLLKDVVYLYYEGKWRDRLPDFEGLKPVRIRPVPSNRPDLSVVKAREFYALQFLGDFQAPSDGDYGFTLESDDGSRLLIGDAVVVDNDGHHPMVRKSGRVALKRGVHEFRLQYYQADGGSGLRLWVEGPSLSRRLLTEEPKVRQEPNREQFHLHVHDEPLVMRTFIDGGAARSIAVGLPGGVNYSFNAGAGAVQLGWYGMFLDIGPDRGYGQDRGGGWSKTLGDRFDVGDGVCLLSSKPDSRAASVKFHGYRRPKGRPPEFLLEVDGIRIRQEVRALPAAGGTPFGLQHAFVVEDETRDLYLHKDPSHPQLDYSSTQGAWQGSVLKIPAGPGRSFTVSIIDRSKAPATSPAP